MATPRTSIGVESMMIAILNQKQCAVLVEAEKQVINGGDYSIYSQYLCTSILIHTYTSESCKNTDKGAKDPAGDGCDAYANNKHWCGNYDDSDFTSKTMCCACGGGTTGSKSRRLLNLLLISMYKSRNYLRNPIKCLINLSFQLQVKFS